MTKDDEVTETPTSTIADHATQMWRIAARIERIGDSQEIRELGRAIGALALVVAGLAKTLESARDPQVDEVDDSDFDLWAGVLLGAGGMACFLGLLFAWGVL